MMTHLIACRIASYGKHQARGWSHLPELGVRHVEVPAPTSPEAEAALQRRLREHGLTASSLQATCDITRADAAEQMRPQLDACQRLAARWCFVSIKAGDTDRALVWDRLRAIGREAEQCGVTVVLETHPDLVTNGEVARQTMEAIDHPRIRVNFDTANVHFYNHGVTTENELDKALPYVAAVHLKDSRGGYRDFNFPTLGRGIVDFPAVFQRLDASGFAGPCTMELEGNPDGVELDESGQLQHVAESVAYLRAIGVF